VTALLALAQDHAFGQPTGSQLRATVLAQKAADVMGLGAAERGTTWWTSTLRFLGCTGHAFETALLFGDEIDLRAWSLRADASNPVELLREMLARAGPGRSGLGRVRAVLSILATGKSAAEDNFRMACEVADAFAVRLGMDGEVRAALAANFERWNGRGLPSGLAGAAIPRPMRIAQITQELEVVARVDTIDTALDMVRSRRGRAYDPEIADVVVAEAPSWWREVQEVDPWDAALALAPPGPALDQAAVREALLVLADFADLKSPWTAGHSRGVADLACAACGPDAEPGALVHDLGRVAVPNSIWDKPGPLTRDERERVELHTLVTEQLLRRVPYLAQVADIAGAAHERLDGSGYHRRAGAAQLGEVARVMAAADCYQALTSDRPHRRALDPTAAAEALRAMASSGQLDSEAVERVLAAAGHHRRARVDLPAGLTAREAEVLALVGRGLTTGQIARALVISAKTADRHIQNTYRKLGVSTRGAAALFAIEHGIVAADSR
jgi:HD-GYP domain-containing protein (c-di-GMP phosphodiesterase class II)